MEWQNFRSSGIPLIWSSVKSWEFLNLSYNLLETQKTSNLPPGTLDA